MWLILDTHTFVLFAPTCFNTSDLPPQWCIKIIKYSGNVSWCVSYLFPVFPETKGVFRNPQHFVVSLFSFWSCLLEFTLIMLMRQGRSVKSLIHLNIGIRICLSYTWLAHLCIATWRYTTGTTFWQLENE